MSTASTTSQATDTLVERFQLLRRPERGTVDAAWASKIHLTVAPVYYQNYLYGELVASQLAAAIDARAGRLVDSAAAGRLWDRRRAATPLRLRAWCRHPRESENAYRVQSCPGATWQDR